MNEAALVRTLIPRNLRNWLRRPGTSARYVRDRLAFACGSVLPISFREGWPLRCHPASRGFFEVFRTDPAQAAELDAFIHHCRAGMRLLDAGAHHGLFALAALHYGGPEASVLCVEPSRAATAILSANLRANGVGRRAVTMLAALGGADGQLEMLTTGPFAGDYLVLPTAPRADAVAIPQLTMSTILARTGFTPTHVKMDIEGSEFEAISAARGLLAQFRPVLFLEIHGDLLRGRGKDPEQLIGILRACGYQLCGCAGGPLSDDELRKLVFNVRVICTAK